MLSIFMCIVWHSTHLIVPVIHDVYKCVSICVRLFLFQLSLSFSLSVCVLMCVFCGCAAVYIIWHQASDIQALQRVFTRRALRKCVHTQGVYIFSSISIFTYVSTFYSLHPQKPHTSFRFLFLDIFF